MDPMDKKIMTVSRDILFKDRYFEGFSHPETDYKEIILGNYEFRRRGDVETDPSYKQPIPYVIILNPAQKKVFVYQRSAKKEDNKEKRLHGKWSLGIGGHVDEADAQQGNPLEQGLLRELKEEVGLEPAKEPQVIGYINDDTDSVGKVHFGVVSAVETENDVFPTSREVVDSKMLSLDELEKLISNPDINMENWSQMAVAGIKKYFSQEKT